MNTKFSFTLLAALIVLLVSLAVTTSFSNAPGSADVSWPPRPVLIPATGGNDLSDFYQRQAELSPAAMVADRTDDFYLRHLEWTGNAQNAVVPMTGNSEASDYFQRHRERSAPVLTESLETPGLACESPVDCR
jgi:hypothetical protein